MKKVFLYFLDLRSGRLGLLLQYRLLGLLRLLLRLLQLRQLHQLHRLGLLRLLLRLGLSGHWLLRQPIPQNQKVY